MDFSFIPRENMNKQISPFQKKSFNDFMNVENGVEFWYARDIMNLFWYQTWQKFKDSIERAKTACEMSGNIVLEHFLPAPVKTSWASGRPSENYKLTRYACYLIAQNGDPRKKERSQKLNPILPYKQEDLSSINNSNRTKWEYKSEKK